METPVIAVHRLTKDMYAVIEKHMPRPSVGKETTDIQAGYLLGVQAVLSLLREEFTVK